MKKKGFTLIELLAVIVVLAIIALIATPIVMNVIKAAQKGAIERSVERYISAVETAIAVEMLDNRLVTNGLYRVDGNGNLVSGEKTLMIEVNGDKPKPGSQVVIEDADVVPNGTNLIMGDNYEVTIDSNGKATAKEKENVTPQELCKAIAPSEQQIWNQTNNAMESKVLGVQATASAMYAVGAVYSCDFGDGARTFYVLEEDGNNIKLIMNKNLGEIVAWCDATAKDPNNNSCNANGAKAYLASQTSGWTKLINAGGKVELPKGEDIANLINDDLWNDTTITKQEVPDWMRANLYKTNVPLGYWTSTANSNKSSEAWLMFYLGYLHSYDFKSYSVVSGVRPVITISKFNMSL